MRYKVTVLAVLAVCLALAASGPLLAGTIPAKSELVISGTYSKAKGAEAVYRVDTNLAAAIGGKGGVLLGPKFRFDSDDTKTAAGAVLHWNFLGSSRSGPYVGAGALYNLKRVEGETRYTGDVEAGLKLQVASDCSKACGGVNISGSKTVWGRGKDGSRPGFFLGTFIRF